MGESNKLVLIIDDDEDIRYTIGEICAIAGWQTVGANNGEEGLIKFTEYRPDIVLVDYHMPRMDGLATVKNIRHLDTTTPVVVLTVDERQKIADAFLKAGATDFALKPIKAPDLISRINVNLRIGEMQKEAAREQQEMFRRTQGYLSMPHPTNESRATAAVPALSAQHPGAGDLDLVKGLLKIPLHPLRQLLKGFHNLHPQKPDQ